ncbi:unnamed protein product [Medioppia subpectinata]|uniref:Nuclear receptor domain-containing protein n=1 Tax=Medioppia subpectinata TaxID=1979941 RepID=A0A7R9L8C6_9ACAR|nr:unnamed protein product [Medioppia subpectinata]CAG2116110.1 unnamed protein product [Medioppia subpectinata]
MTIKDKICLICGDGAIGKNFGAVSCETCKAFFRRNAAKRDKYVCLYNKKCQIGLNTRKFCRTCRLEKCFAVGMKEDWILNDEQREERRLKIEAKRLKRNKNADKCKDKLETRSVSSESPDENNVLNTKINDWTTGPQSVDHDVFETDTSNSSDGTHSIDSGYESALIPVVRPVLVINNNFNASEHQFFSELLSAISQLDLNVNPVAIHELKTFEEVKQSVVPRMESDFKAMVNVCKSLHTFRCVCDSDRMALFKPASREALMLYKFGLRYDYGNQCWYNINMDDGTVYVHNVDVFKQIPGNAYPVAKRLLYNIENIMDTDHYIIQLVLIPILLFNPERPNLMYKDLVKLQQRLYMYLLKRYLTIKYGSETEANTRFKQILDTLHDVNTLCEIQLKIERSRDPREVGPLMREIMDIPSNDNYIYTILQLTQQLADGSAVNHAVVKRRVIERGKRVGQRYHTRHYIVSSIMAFTMSLLLFLRAFTAFARLTLA